MTITEFYYTSCRHGLTGTAGIQFNAVSAGAPSTLLRQVEPYLGYEAPPGQPLLPSREELDLFPVALSYLPLDDGAIVARSCYLGADNSGRPGNFFTHALHLSDPPVDLGGARAIELWEASWWTATESTERELPAPPRPRPGRTVHRRWVLDFLSTGDRQHRLADFLSMVGRALRSDPYAQVLLLGGDIEHAVGWTAAASYSLPREIVCQLSFSTYARHVTSSPYMLVGQAPGTEPEPSGLRGGKSYVVFDDQADSTARPPGPEPDLWAVLASELWHHDRLHGLERMERMLDARVAPLTTADLDGVFAAQALADAPDSGLLPAVKWATKWARLDDEPFWERFGAALSARANMVPLGALGELLGAWTEAHPPGPQPEYVVEYFDRILGAAIGGAEVIEEAPWLPGLAVPGVAERLQMALSQVATAPSPAEAALVLVPLVCQVGSAADRVVQELIDQHIGPTLLRSRHDYADRVVASLSASSSRPAVSKVLAYLNERVRDKPAQLVDWRGWDAIARWLDNSAPATYPELVSASLLSAARSSTQSHPAMLHQVLQDLRTQDLYVQTVAVDVALDWMWDGRPPSTGEVAALLEALPPRLLRSRAVAHRLINDCLVPLRRIDGASDAVAARMETARTALDNWDRAVLEAVRLGRDLQLWQDVPEGVSLRAIGLIEVLLQTEVAEALREELCKWLLRLPPNWHRQELRAVFADEFTFRRYLQLARENVRAGFRSNPQAVAGYFAAWSDQRVSAADRLNYEDVISAALLPVIDGATRRQRWRVTRAIRKRGARVDHWNSLCRRAGEPSSWRWTSVLRRPR